MKCTSCHGDTRVFTTKRVGTGLTKRGRECLQCRSRIYTYERPDRTPQEEQRRQEVIQKGRDADRRHVEGILRNLNKLMRHMEELGWDDDH